jgi:hypothetical protein
MRRLLALLTLTTMIGCGGKSSPPPPPTTTPPPATATEAPPPGTITEPPLTGAPRPTTIITAPVPEPPITVHEPPISTIPPVTAECTEPAKIVPANPALPGSRPYCTQCGKLVDDAKCGIKPPPPPIDASKLPCSRGVTVPSVPLYASGISVKYPAGYVPNVVYGIKSPGGSWRIFDFYLQEVVMAGTCLGSWSGVPCSTLGLETNALCGKDLAGKAVQRWPGKPEVNVFKIYQRGMTSAKNPAFTDDGKNRLFLTDPSLVTAWKSWPYSGLAK